MAKRKKEFYDPSASGFVKCFMCRELKEGRWEIKKNKNEGRLRISWTTSNEKRFTL